MHSVYMLAEIVKARPHLIPPGTVLAEADIHLLGPASRLLLVNTFLMSFEVIDRSESFLTVAVRFVAFKGLLMSRFMFSDGPVSDCALIYTCFNIDDTSCRTDTCRANCILDSHI